MAYSFEKIAESVVSVKKDGVPKYQIEVGTASCTCPDFLYRHHKCKHLEEYEKAINRPLRIGFPEDMVPRQAYTQFMEKHFGPTSAVACGEYRRGKMWVNNLPVVISEADYNAFVVVLSGVCVSMEGSSVLSTGHSSTELEFAFNGYLLPVTVYSYGSKHLGAATMAMTGSKEFNGAMRNFAKKKGLKLNQYGVFDAPDEFVVGDTEEAVFAALGLPMIPPDKRHADYLLSLAGLA